MAKIICEICGKEFIMDTRMVIYLMRNNIKTGICPDCEYDIEMSKMESEANHQIWDNCPY